MRSLAALVFLSLAVGVTSGAAWVAMMGPPPAPGVAPPPEEGEETFLAPASVDPLQDPPVAAPADAPPPSNGTANATAPPGPDANESAGADAATRPPADANATSSGNATSTGNAASPGNATRNATTNATSPPRPEGKLLLNATHDFSSGAGLLQLTSAGASDDFDVGPEAGRVVATIQFVRRNAPDLGGDAPSVALAPPEGKEQRVAAAPGKNATLSAPAERGTWTLRYEGSGPVEARVEVRFYTDAEWARVQGA